LIEEPDAKRRDLYPSLKVTTTINDPSVLVVSRYSYSAVHVPVPRSNSDIPSYYIPFPDTPPRKSLFVAQSIPRSPSYPFTVTELANHWLTDHFTQDPFIDFSEGLATLNDTSAFVYKKVANKIRPVATTLPEEFRIVRRPHPNPLGSMAPLPSHPPSFLPTKRFTAERRASLKIGEDGFLWPEEVKLVEWLFAYHDQAFAWNDNERGTFSEEYFDPIVIPHISHIPWVLKQGGVPPGILDEVIRIVKSKIESGVYEPSNSSYRSRWFCVLKKDGHSLRLVHSLEPLNAITIKDAASPPMTDAIAEAFACRAAYSAFDLYVSFDHRQLAQQSRDLTTFQSPLGALRLTVIPMGYTNSPQIMHGDVTFTLAPEIPHVTQPFVDDIPVKGPQTRYETTDGSYETIPENSGIRRFIWETLQNTHRVIQRMKVVGATFNPKKSFMAIERAEIVGHICTYEGRIPDDSRVRKIRSWPAPTCLTEVRAFLGTCGVLRIFIKDFARIARPLVLLTKKDVPFQFGTEELEAMNNLKDAFLRSPALRPIEYDTLRAIVLAVDSCPIACGFILLQLGEDNKRYPNRFGSITFNDRESRYSQAKLELFGLFRALKQVRIHIIGVRNFIVEVDAKYIKGMLNNPDIQPNAAINRWIASILLFDFKLIHVPGDRHTGADGLSRRPHTDDDDAEEDFEDWIDEANGFTISIDNWLPIRSRPAIPSMKHFPSVRTPRPCPSIYSYSIPIVTTLPMDRSPSPLPDGSDSDSDSDAVIFPSPDNIAIPRSGKALRRDDKLVLIRAFLDTLRRPPELSDRDFHSFVRQASDFFLRDEVLWRKQSSGNHQLVPPPEKRLDFISDAHDRLGHKGVFSTVRILLTRFWWPMLQHDVKWFVTTCHVCQTRQTRYFHIPPTVPHVPTLFRKVHIDTFLMPIIGNYRYVVHARDALTAWPEWRALTSETGVTLGNFIFEEILCRWGAVEEIVTDNGPAFVSAVEHISAKYGIRHIRISGYNSQANGIVERQHFPVREAIMKTCDGDERKWRSVIHAVFWAERVTIQRATGYSPFYMVHGVQPILPFDIAEATYLVPKLDAGISTSELISIRARQLLKREQDLAAFRSDILQARIAAIRRFEKTFSKVIVDFDFPPGALVLLRNSKIEESLNRKTKPRYLGPMIVIKRTQGGSYILAELNGAISKVRAAAFRVVPYVPRSRSSISITELVDVSSEELDAMTHEDTEGDELEP
jgi:hypothetical protein